MSSLVSMRSTRCSSALGVAGRRQQQPRAHHLEQQARAVAPSHLHRARRYHLGVARASVAEPTWAAWSRIRSSTSSGRRPRRDWPHPEPLAAQSDRGIDPAGRWRTAAGRGRRRSPTRPHRTGRPASPAARASDGVIDQRTSVAPSRASARWYVHPGCRRRRPKAGRARWGCRHGRPAARPDHRGRQRHRSGRPSAAQMRFDQRARGARRQQPERVVVGARPDGGSTFLRFGCGEDEDEVLRRLSTIFSRALKPAVVTMCASSTMRRCGKRDCAGA